MPRWVETIWRYIKGRWVVLTRAYKIGFKFYDYILGFARWDCSNYSCFEHRRICFVTVRGELRLQVFESEVLSGIFQLK